MRQAALVALLFAVGCTDGSGTGITPTDSGDGDLCPAGTAAAGEAGAVVTNYIQNGISLAIVYDENATLTSGQPAACVSADAKLAQWILVSGEGPHAVFRMSLTDFGSQPIDGSTSSATLEILGVDTVDANEWQTGTWFADYDSNTGKVTTTLDATGVTAGGGNYSITASFEATP